MQVSALAEVQVKVLDPLGGMASGSALILTVGAGWVTVLLSEPAWPELYQGRCLFYGSSGRKGDHAGQASSR